MPRKSKYKPEFPKKVEELAGEGRGDIEIYKSLGISHETFYKWIKQEEGNKDFKLEFLESLKKGREKSIQNVENALYKRAMGHDYTEEHTEVFVNKNGETTSTRTKNITKEVAPDTTAQIFFLKNRKPEEWKDRQDLTHLIKQELPFNVSIKHRKKRIDSQ